MGTPPAAPERVYSIDAYRGFTMLAMISAGMGFKQLAAADHSWDWLAYQFDHPVWVGYSAWDLIHPSFMFIVGGARPFAFAVRRARGDSWGWQFAHALKRSLLLILIGIFLDSFGQDRVNVQFIRVLQQ